MSVINRIFLCIMTLMKKILSIVLILTTVSIIPVSASVEHKVIKVIDGDTVYVDFNDNRIAEQDEKVRINGIDTFETKLNDGLNWQMKLYNLTQDEALGLGYYGKEFAKKELLNKSVRAEYTAEEKFDKNNRHLMSLYYDCNRQGKCKSYEKEVLKAGLATIYTKSNLADELKQYQNLDKIKAHAKKSHKLDLVVLNKKNDKYHKLDCKYGWMSSQQELIDKPLIKYSTASCCYPESQNQAKNISFIQQQKEKVFLNRLEKQKIELYFVNPVNKKHPVNKSINDVSKSLEALINNAESSIDIAAYGFAGQDNIINTLRRAKARGVTIRGVVDDYGTSLYPDTEKIVKEFGFKTDVFVPIAQRQFDEKFTRSQSALMHNKFVIVDGKYIWTGSTNITDSCMTFNANNSVVIYSQYLAQIYEKEFSQMFEDNKFHVLKGVVPNKTDIQIKPDTEISILFSPMDRAISKGVLPLINKSGKSIYISMFYLTNYWITDALIDAHNRGVDIKIISDATLTKEPKAQIFKLREAGIPVKIENWNGKMHQKSAVFDEEYTIIASTNWTGASEYANDENMLIIKNKDIAAKQTKEFFRLWKSIPDKFLYEIPNFASKKLE